VFATEGQREKRRLIGLTLAGNGDHDEVFARLISQNSLTRPREFTILSISRLSSECRFSASA
jgi:hypothetical protein